MGIGKLVLNTIGYKKRYFSFFQKLHELSAMGMGYTRLWVDQSQEDFFIGYANKLLNKHEINVFDVGANKGGFLNSSLKIINDKKVDYHAFEPNSELHNTIIERVNGQLNTELFLSNYAVSDENGSRSFFLKDMSVTSSLYSDNRSNKEVSVDTITLEKYAQEKGIIQIDLLKIDTEGHDLFVLKGADKLIQKRTISFILFEFSNMAMNPRVYFKDFWDYLSPNYSLYYILSDGLLPIKEYSPYYHEINYPNNFMAISKSVYTE